jgi:transposase InsO family protein
MILTSEPTVRFEIIREISERENNILNISWLCEIAGVSRGGYYNWLSNEKNRVQAEEKDKGDFKLILAAYKFKGYDKGASGVHMRLLHQHPPVRMNVKKVRRLMRKYGLKCPIRKANPYRKMMKASQLSRVAPNLLERNFKAYGSRTVLLTDITYVPRGNGKFTYLSVIMDAFTKQVLAYIMSVSLEVDFVLMTVEQLVKNHAGELKTDCLTHSDQGFHYTSHSFKDILGDAELRQSMSRRGNCWDNAPQESFFGHMKDNIGLCASDRNPQIVKKVNSWMKYYNNERYQWRLCKLSPNEFYEWVENDVWPLPTKPPDKTFREAEHRADSRLRQNDGSGGKSRRIGKG